MLVFHLMLEDKADILAYPNNLLQPLDNIAVAAVVVSLAAVDIAVVALVVVVDIAVVGIAAADIVVAAADIVVVGNLVAVVVFVAVAEMSAGSFAVEYAVDELLADE